MEDNSSLAAKVYPIKSLAVVARHHTISLTLQDSILLSAILCTASAALYTESEDLKHRLSTLYFKGQTIQALNQALLKSQTLGASSLYAISLLLWVEVSSLLSCWWKFDLFMRFLQCIQGGLLDMETHLAGLQKLLARSGALDDCPLPFVATIFSSSLLGAAMLRACPKLSPRNWHPEIVSLQPLRKLLNHPPMGSKCQAAVSSGRPS